ncbi:MAG: hypothetical protein GY757_02890, partial [bacterium]|nr:hypothetical protein [bacterium]
KENKIWFTNGMARYLYSRAPGETDMLEKARGYLRKFWDGHTFPGYEHNNWMGIVTFAGTGEPGDEDIQRGCLDNLETKIETYDFADVVWALESLYQLKFDANRPIVKKCIRRLETGQLEDGGMQTEYEEHQRVDVGIEVLDSLANYSLIPRHIDFEKYGKQN